MSATSWKTKGDNVEKDSLKSGLTIVEASCIARNWKSMEEHQSA